eukprot:786450-Rhodomonas_salina.1
MERGADLDDALWRHVPARLPAQWSGDASSPLYECLGSGRVKGRGFEGLGSRVQGLGSRVWRAELSGSGLGSIVSGLGSRVSGLGSRV